MTDAQFESIMTCADPEPDCWCETCRPITISDMRMVLCPTCGNKRCPHASDHRNACSGRNEVGQKGIPWENVKPWKPAETGTAHASRASTILAIDPGTTESGWCLYHTERGILGAGVKPNDFILDEIRYQPVDHLAIEMIASYGMAVGREVFETCVWIGRMVETFRYPSAVRLVYRRDVKLHLCGSPRAKDANIRQALLDMFPATGGGKTPQIGTKLCPGPLYGVSSHAWAALGVAVTAAHQMKEET